MTLRAVVNTVLVMGAALSGVGLLTPSVESHPRITTTLLWNTDIAPILQRRCYHCHTGQNVAMSLATYRDGRPWAAAIREEALTRRMPPWSAVAGYGHFSNDNSLTQRELDLLVAWADGGAPSGQTLAEEEMPAVFVPSTATWQHGTPDIVLAPAAPQRVAASADAVVRVEMPTGFKAPQHVRAIAFKPGDRRVVRWASVREKASGRWLFSWAPWQSDVQLPAGSAFVLPAGTALTVDIAYHGAGEDVTDASEVGLYLAEGAARPARTHELGATAAHTIEAGAPAVRIRAESTLAEATAIFALWVELGVEGRSVEVTAMLPDGGVQPLLWLKDYRADFRSPYVFVDPVVLPREARLVMTVYAANPGGEPVKVEPRVSYVQVPAGSTTR